MLATDAPFQPTPNLTNVTRPNVDETDLCDPEDVLKERWEVVSTQLHTLNTCTS